MIGGLHHPFAVGAALPPSHRRLLLSYLILSTNNRWSAWQIMEHIAHTFRFHEDVGFAEEEYDLYRSPSEALREALQRAIEFLRGMMRGLAGQINVLGTTIKVEGKSFTVLLLRP